MFTVSREGNTVRVSGFVSVQFVWAPKPEMLSPSQAGVTRCLLGHGFVPVSRVKVSSASFEPGWAIPVGAKGVFSGDKVVCRDEADACVAEMILSR